MSLLHRNLLAAAFAQIEPILLKTLEAAAPAVGPAAPAVELALQGADAVYQASQATPPASDSPPAQIAAAIAAQSRPAAPPAAAAPLVNLAADKTSAALAAVDALGLQLSQLATQLAAIRSNLAPSS